MYRLLIVDNESIIVDGLYELFQEVADLELEVFKAYTSKSALEIVSSMKMDIVFTDIRMPGLTGLELQLRIARMWPRCKTIFITGYNDFESAQSAIRNGGFDFVLKSEGDAKILEVMYKAVNCLNNELNMDALMHKSRSQLHLALPLLQNQYLLNLLEGGRKPDDRVLADTFRELEIPLDWRLPVSVLAGRIDSWPQSFAYADRALLHYAMENIIEEYLNMLNLKFIPDESSRFYLISQPIQENGEPGPKSWEQLHLSISGNLGEIQNKLKELLKLPVSMIYREKPVPWRQLPDKVGSLKSALYSEIGLQREVILTDRDRLTAQAVQEGSSSRDWAEYANLLEISLESGQKEEFEQAYRELLSDGEERHYSTDQQLTIFYTIGLALLRNGMKGTEPQPEEIRIQEMLDYSRYSSWKEAMLELFRIAGRFFDLMDRERDDSSQRAVKVLHHYIETNLDADLSLTKLSEVVHLNPVYLSRFYIEQTGGKLSEYIMKARLDKAKALLSKPDMKIQDICKIIGLDSPSYFSRFFKKGTNMSPQEYRELKIR
ncbi:MAG: response regulator [Paenibacillaceae bacterium]|jgi:two-component system response regulator YesN|nr:response regulator [Paenibacillaceae bacterium]